MRKVSLFFCTTLFFLGFLSGAFAQTSIITTAVNSSGTGGFVDDVLATAGRIDNQYLICVDASDNLYIADFDNSRIRKVTASTGIISTVAGSAATGSLGDGGTATTAQLGAPSGGGLRGVVGVAVDAAGNIYIGDATNHKIRFVNAATGIISTYAGTGTAGFSGDGGPATAAQLSGPRGIALDALGNVYFSDGENQRIRMIIAATGTIITIAGNGTAGYLGDGVVATTTRISGVRGLYVDATGNVFIADQGNNRIRRIAAFTNIITTVAGTGTAGSSGIPGPATAAQLSQPLDVKFDAIGNMYIADNGSNRIKMVNTSGIMTTVVGNGTAGVLDGSPATAGRVNGPASIAITSNPNYWYISDRGNNRIRLVKPNSPPIFTGGATTGIAVCQNSTANSINSILQVMDSNLQQTLTWTVASAALHGTVAPPSTSTSNGTPITPTGATYTPTAGYSGLDTFTIQIADGANTGGSIQVIVTVNPLPVVPAIGGPASVCVGGSVTQTNTTGGGLWEASNANVTIGSASGVVNGVSVGTVTISYTVTNACGFTRVVRILTVNTVPATPAAISGSSSVCAGSSAILTSATPGGVWTSNNSAIASMGSATGVMTGVSAGTTTITYTATNGCGSTFVTAPVTVNTAPGAITGSAVSCVGSSNTLSSSPGGGTWASSNTAAATIGSLSGSVLGIGVGTTTISYTLANGCFSTLPVTVNNPPSASGGPPTVCVGGTTTLTNSGGGTWTSGSANATVGSASGIVSGVTAGTAVITYSVGTCFVTTTVTVIANPSAITPPGAVGICVGATTTLADATPGGTWSSGSTGIATVGTSGIVTGVSPGVATISYTNTSGCAATKNITVNITPSALSPSSSPVCAGSTITFTNSVSGGTWTSSAPGTASVAGGVVSGVSAGTATITYTIGTCFVTAPVTVIASPAAITPAGAVSICVGATASLSDPTPGGTWSSGAPGVATVGTAGLVTGVSGGSATISYTNVSGCPATKVVTVNSTPSAITPSSTTICTGTTVTLTNSVSGGTWTSSAPGTASVSAGGVVTGVAVGTATITYAIGTCTALATVTVNLSPSAGTITGPTLVCVGATASLSNATSGGVWSSSAPGIASVGSTGIVTGVSAGAATISYTVTNGCGTISTTAPMTVNAAASAGTITGVGMLCAGTFTTLVASAPGGTWSVTNTHATISSTGLLTAISPGIDTVLYTVINACGPVSARHIVSIGAFLSAGTLSGPGDVCQGSSITLTSTVPGGTWSSSTSAATVVGGVVTGVSGGLTIISYTNTSFCGTATATHLVNVTALPDAGTVSGPTILCAGMTAPYTTAGTGGTWSVTNPTAAITTGGVVTAVTAGIDTVVYTVINSCGIDVSSIALTIGPAITAGSNSGPGTVCEGSFIILTNTTPGGVWSASNTNATVAGGVVTGVSAGTVDISYTVTGSCGSVAAVSTIIVNPLPVAGTVTGPSIVCAGSAITLSESVSGGVWTASNTNATVIGGVVSGVSVGTVDISYTVTNSCGSASTANTITVSTIPAAGSLTGASSVCVGAIITLSATVPGGTWSASNTNATVVGSGLVSGVTAGMVDISYTVTNTCGSSATASTLTVNPLPDAGSIAGPTSVCVGASITLTDAAPGGTWSASNTNATVAGGVVTGVTAGMVDISYTVTNVCGTAHAISSITVNPAPDAGTLTGGSDVCVGSTMTLTESITGGSWSTSNTNATVAGGVVTGVSVGMVDISYAVTNVCGTAVVSVPVNVQDLPVAAVITGPASVCKSATITLSNTTPGGVWSASNTNATVTSGGVVTGVNAGTVVITYTVTNPCGTVTSTKSITITQAPSAGSITGPSTVCAGQNITLANGVMGGTWSSGNPGVASVATTGVVSGIAAGTATISYTMANSCGNRSATRTVVVLSPADCGGGGVSVKGTAQAQDELKVFPNPNKGSFNLHLITGNEEPVTVIITNIIGRKIKEFTTTTNKITEVQMNTSPGIYLLTATTGNGRYVSKVTVE